MEHPSITVEIHIHRFDEVYVTNQTGHSKNEYVEVGLGESAIYLHGRESVEGLRDKLTTALEEMT